MFVLAVPLVLGDRRLGLAILGADLVWRMQIGTTGNDYSDRSTQNEFTKHEGKCSALLYDMLNRRWKPGILRIVHRSLSIGPRFYLTLPMQRAYSMLLFNLIPNPVDGDSF